jgi:multidrug efflux system outer membrane protein
VPADQAGKTDSASFGDQKCWETFQDETLQQLIRTALQQNYDVRMAAAQILQAGAQLGITRADQFPAISAGAATVNERIPQSLAQPAVDASATQAANNMPPPGGPYRLNE